MVTLGVPYVPRKAAACGTDGKGTVRLVRQRLNRPATLDHADQNHNDGQHQQNVHESAHRVRSDQTSSHKMIKITAIVQSKSMLCSSEVISYSDRAQAC